MSDPRDDDKDDDDRMFTQEEVQRFIEFLESTTPPDPLRDCNYLLSLPRVCPGKAWRN